MAIRSTLNRRRYTASLHDAEHRDTTRPQYDFYGINWGAKADMMVQDMIDTGDVVFVSYACGECVDVKTMAKCYCAKVMPSPVVSYDDVGIAVRHREQISIIHEVNGKLTSTWYNEFLASPFYTDIVHRRLLIEADDEFKKIFKQRVMLYEIQAKKGDLSDKKSPILLNDFFKTMNISDYPLDVVDLDDRHPAVFKSIFSLGKKVVIRSELNKDLARPPQ